MKTITIGTIKGGDGKSSLCILLSRYLASIGKRVLTIDLDVQNSTSYSLLPDGDPGGRHIVRAIIEDDIASQTIQLGPCHFLVQCDYKLTQLRTMSAQTIRSAFQRSRRLRLLPHRYPTLLRQHRHQRHDRRRPDHYARDAEKLLFDKGKPLRSGGPQRGCTPSGGASVCPLQLLRS